MEKNEVELPIAHGPGISIYPYMQLTGETEGAVVASPLHQARQDC